jgi:cell division protein FtsZ
MPIELDFSYHSGARIRVIGVGGAGGNAVRTMMSRGLEHVEFIAANTDSQALMRNPAPTKIQLGNGSTRGLGAGAKPDVGRSAVEESLDEVRDALIGSDMVFVTAGMGGGTGTGAAPIIAREAHELGALVVGIVTRPFSFENKQRAKIAEQGIREMRDAVDALIVIPNDRILSVVDASVPFRIALEKADEVLYNATRGIADIIHAEGIVNVDFADVVTVMKNQGDAMMGIGIGSGERRAMEAAQNALNSPILEGMQIYGAQGLLVNITGGESLTMHEVSEAVSCIQKAAGEEANLIHGVVVDESYDDEISITVVATGFQRQEMVAGTQPEPIRKASLPLTIIRNDQSAPERPLEIETIEPVETPYRPAAQEQSTSPVLNVPAGIDPNDPDTPAIWRNKGKHGGGSTQSSAPQRQAASASAPAPQASASPSTYTAPSTTSSDQPDAFLRPRKSASSGGGSGQPAFLRKIMD